MNTIQDAIDFIRLSGLLKDWTDEQLAAGMTTAIKDGAACFSTDKFGNIDGLVFGRWIVPAEHIFVRFAAGNGRLKDFFRFLRKTFPNCKQITAIRFGKEITYNI